MEHIYLDWAATALPDQKLLNEALESSLKSFANPSSPHKSGREASAIVGQQRKILAGCFGTDPRQLIFTSGGTESNNMVVFSLLKKKRKGNIIISGIEHPSIYEPAASLEKFGWKVRIVNPEPSSIVDPEKMASMIDEETRMVLLIMVNNETGAIQPVNEIGKLIQKSAAGQNIHFHIDAVQAAGKIPLNLGALPVHSASISSHKFQGPRGCGLLYLKKPLEMLYAGGGQEGGLRHGTENTFGMIGTALAAAANTAAIDDNINHALGLKKILIDRISKIKGSLFIPRCSTEELLNPIMFSPYILLASLPPVPGEILVRVMSDRGFEIGTGSACATGKKKKSRIMDAIGIKTHESFSAVRISTGPKTDMEEIHRFCDTLEKESTILINSLKR
ncbi:MAG: cysteine desulfurase [Spirochaetales bacterium]|nr:cysteine desulfurase [Spirochaetales bacterium]